MTLKPLSTLTFDRSSALIDWESGMLKALASLLPRLDSTVSIEDMLSPHGEGANNL